jgi:hypothetical protein
MKRQDVATLAVVAFVSAIIAFIITSLVFTTPKNRSSKVPSLNTVTTSFPDIKNDPSYKAFLNSNALDPTQPVQIGTTQNNTPFNGTQ